MMTNNRRFVFDTNVLISAFLFSQSKVRLERIQNQLRDRIATNNVIGEDGILVMQEFLLVWLYRLFDDKKIEVAEREIIVGFKALMSKIMRQDLARYTGCNVHLVSFSLLPAQPDIILLYNFTLTQ